MNNGDCDLKEIQPTTAPWTTTATTPASNTSKSTVPIELEEAYTPAVASNCPYPPDNDVLIDIHSANEEEVSQQDENECDSTDDDGKWIDTAPKRARQNCLRLQQPKRKANSNRRSRFDSFVSCVRKRWKYINSLMNMSDTHICDLQCCTAKCFQNVNIAFLRDRTTFFLVFATRENRRAGLYYMLTSGKNYCFDGKIVWSTFLLQGFRYSPDSQSAVKSDSNIVVDGDFTEAAPSRTENTTGVSSIAGPQADFNSNQPDIQPVVSGDSATPITGSADQSESGAFSTSNAGNDVHMQDYKYDLVILFLDRLVDKTADRMPDSGEAHISFFEKTEVYILYTTGFSKLYDGDEIPSWVYFTTVWKKHFSCVKVRKTPRFTKSSTCERLREALFTAATKRLPTKN